MEKNPMNLKELNEDPYEDCICILELLLTTYALHYHFQSDDPLIQLVEDYKWIQFFDFHLFLISNGNQKTGSIYKSNLCRLMDHPIGNDNRMHKYPLIQLVEDYK
ncbi:hypothetical protein CDL12_15130 [Handroanthus impetiginosus]|uniref:Uncharacterized protein n=1 Tax=Handroanthus impetiginosus TaxID=429701 RepID=A0A2G9H415_9LAMI|nr:hypothetical protein CDL12_15130 [Handroanthus impetiginosus]